MDMSRRSLLCGAVAAAAAVPFAAAEAKQYTKGLKWHNETDVLVVGYGGAGACAAIEAHDKGAQVLVIEKMKQPGGNTAVSAGGFMIPQDAQKAKVYLNATYELGNSEKDEILLDTFCKEIMSVKEWMQSLQPEVKVMVYGHAGFQTLEGWEVIDKYRVRGKKAGGDCLFDLLMHGVESRKIPVMLETPAKQLIVRDGEVLGVVAESEGKLINIKAKKAVILTTGGFEYDPQSLQTFAMGVDIHALGNPGNTGDGLRMASSVGARLWHMTSYSCQLGTELPGCKAAFQVSMVAPSFIWVNKFGKRFSDEFSPDGHTRGYVVNRFDPISHSYPAVPCWHIFDQKALERGPATVTKSGYAVNREGYKWSKDNSQEVANGVIIKAATIKELAEKIGVPADNLEETVKKWNEDMKAGKDTLFNRPILNPHKKIVHADQKNSAAVSAALDEKGPFYAMKLWPSLLNTQGGPKKDVNGRVVDNYDKPIPRLYAAGELGSMWGSIYQGACNNAECIVFGRLAGRSAAKEKAWK